MIGVLSCFWRKRVGGVIVFSLFFLATGLSLALTPPPGTPVVNTVFVDYRDARGNALPRVTASVQTPVSAGVVLKISKQASSDPVAMGALLTYTLHYENTGNAAASNLILVDQLSDYVVFQSATAGGIYTPGPPAGGTVTWALGTLPAGGYGSVSVTVRVKTSSDYPSGDPSVIQTGSQVVNEFSLTSTEASVRGSLATTVGVSANLELSKTQSLAAVRP
ncbi:MAG TPA: hypothetical protein PK644_10635, partial [bacterium]|nr:hypothetical protein [bacterium]